MTASNLLKFCECQEWRLLTSLAKFLTLVPQKFCYNACFSRRTQGKIESKMVVLEVAKTCAAIKLCEKLGYISTERFNLIQRGGDAPEMKKYSVKVAIVV